MAPFDSYRIALTLISLLFPPLSVLILCGGGWDCVLNCVFFLCAVIPAHIHGFYINCVYFHRRHKVRHGRYPGPPKSMIHSANVNNGGASDREVQLLWREEHGVRRERRRRSRI